MIKREKKREGIKKVKKGIYKGERMWQINRALERRSEVQRKGRAKKVKKRIDKREKRVQDKLVGKGAGEDIEN